MSKTMCFWCGARVVDGVVTATRAHVCDAACEAAYRLYVDTETDEADIVAQTGAPARYSRIPTVGSLDEAPEWSKKLAAARNAK